MANTGRGLPSRTSLAPGILIRRPVSTGTLARLVFQLQSHVVIEFDGTYAPHIDRSYPGDGHVVRAIE